MRDRKEIEAEKLANTIHDTFASAYALDEKVDPEWLKNVTKQALNQTAEKVRLAILDSSIERLRGELYENKTSECNCRGWDNGIQKEIDHLTAQRVMIEKL